MNEKHSRRVKEEALSQTVLESDGGMLRPYPSFSGHCVVLLRELAGIASGLEISSELAGVISGAEVCGASISPNVPH